MIYLNTIPNYVLSPFKMERTVLKIYKTLVQKDCSPKINVEVREYRTTRFGF